LTTEETTIKIEDIRKGDTIRAEYIMGTITHGRTGVAYEKDSDGDWLTVDGSWLTDVLSTTHPRTYTLVDRPKKELPKEKGSVIIATRVRGVEGRWTMFLDGDGDWIAPEEIDTYSWHNGDKIEDWIPVNLVEA